MAVGRPPSIGSTPPIQSPPASPARAAAQRAFFEAALGRAQAPVQTRAAVQVAAPAPVPAGQAAASPQAPGAPEPPARYRPGALLDIKI